VKGLEVKEQGTVLLRVTSAKLLSDISRSYSIVFADEFAIQ